MFEEVRADLISAKQEISEAKKEIIEFQESRERLQKDLIAAWEEIALLKEECLRQKAVIEVLNTQIADLKKQISLGTNLSI